MFDVVVVAFFIIKTYIQLNVAIIFDNYSGDVAIIIV